MGIYPQRATGNSARSTNDDHFACHATPAVSAAGVGLSVPCLPGNGKGQPAFEIALNSEEEAAQFRDLMLIASQAYAKRSLLESDTEPLQNSSKQDGFSISQESEPDVC